MQSRMVLISILACVIVNIACASAPRAATSQPDALPTTAESSSPSTQIADPTDTPSAATLEPAREVTILRDLAYAELSEAQKLDLYIPPGNGPFPLIVYVHGGGWEMGDKREVQSSGMAAHFVSRGYAFASLNYRLSGEATFPAHIHDVKTAIRWLRAHADEYHLDPQRFGGMGNSAGANLISLAGTSCGVPELEGADLGNSDQSSCLQAVVDWFGPAEFLTMNEMMAPECSMDHDAPDSPESKYLGGPIQEVPDIARAASPITYVTADDPPFFIQHGTADCTAPYQQSQLFYDALVEVLGTDQVTLMFLEGAEHADPIFVTEENLKLSSGFMDSVLK